jgi:hypothetical protein
MPIHAATMEIIAAAKRIVATGKLFRAWRKPGVAAPITIVAASMRFSATAISFAAPLKIEVSQKCPGSRQK